MLNQFPFWLWKLDNEDFGSRFLWMKDQFEKISLKKIYAKNTSFEKK